jgi:hypothetical protein
MAEDIAPRDVVEVATTLARIAQAGAPLAPDDPVVDDIRNLLGVSLSKPIELIDPSVMTDENGMPIEGDPGNPDAPAGTGAVGADGKPLQNPEAQRLPRNTALGSDPVKRANGRML